VWKVEVYASFGYELENRVHAQSSGEESRWQLRSLDGGIETRIIYEFKHAIGDFESFELLKDESGRNILRQIYQSYADVAVRYGLPIQLGTPTWRASRKWTSDVMRVNAEAVELLREVAHPGASTRVILAGVIGPASDGYAAREALAIRSEDPGRMLRNRSTLHRNFSERSASLPLRANFSEMSQF
jgi:hypothetical protein